MFRALFEKRSGQQGGISWLVAGLGNPEKKYDGTRHNAGFAAADSLAASFQIGLTKTFRRALTGTGRIGNEKVMIAKPLTYMNASGEAVRALSDYLRIDTGKRLIVIVDDIHLPVGTVRIREKGSAGGHNGLKSIIRHVGHDGFIRIRIGVGEDAGADLVGHVLGKVAPEERARFEESIEKAAEAAALIITDGISCAMNRCNTKRNKES
ncbi:MAG: aminoacyl-tRNA hydrolase [Lachnospiraceae bacterium]|nr:aminoacyl-tRNA hydrolase [Lachnospiraceae bacterium]